MEWLTWCTKSQNTYTITLMFFWSRRSFLFLC
jgi:hypothetical protein